MKDIVLASASAIRAQILRNAGVEFSVARPRIDEDALKHSLGDMPAELLAAALARGKALSIARPGAIVIGSDQILEFEGGRFDKPASMKVAADRLWAMQGRAHRLVNGLCVAENGAPVFETVAVSVLKMRAMTRNEIGSYLSSAGQGVLSSVGAYQVEGVGARLFEAIEGDYFSVLGLPLLPLLGLLRERGALPW